MARADSAPSEVPRLETADLPGGFALRGHGHGSPHLCMVLDGGLAERDGARTREWGGDWIRVSGPDTEHDLRAVGPAARCLIVEFSPQLLPPGLRRPGSAFVEARDSAQALRGWAERYVRHAPAGPSPGEALTLESRLAELLARIDRAGRIGREIAPPPWLERVRRRLDRTLAEPPSLAQLAQEAQVHPSHLARAFRDHYGQTIGAHLRSRRLQLARRSLLTTDRSLAEIAALAGFADQAHLSRAFARRWGLPPGRFRKAVVQLGDATPVQDAGPIRAST